MTRLDPDPLYVAEEWHANGHGPVLLRVEREERRHALTVLLAIAAVAVLLLGIRRATAAPIA